MADLSNVRVDGARLWDSLMEMAKIGATPKGGCKRLTLTDLDKQGRELFRGWCEAAGCAVKVDEMGNMFARRPGQDDSLAPVMMGSHLDTQPTGGKFDGVLGVLGALEVVRSLNDLKIKTRRPIEVANWTNEEGSRFAPAMISSGVFAGVYDQGIRLFPARRRGQVARRRTRPHRLQGRGAGRRAAGPRLLRTAYRAGADPRGREFRRRRRHPRPGPALVRNSLDRLREPRRLDADAAPQGRPPRRRADRRARQRDRPQERAARRVDRRHAQPLSEFAQRDPRRSLHDLRVPPSGRRDPERHGRGAARRRGGRSPRRSASPATSSRSSTMRRSLSISAASTPCAAPPSISAIRTATSSPAPGTTPATSRASRRPR